MSTVIRSRARSRGGGGALGLVASIFGVLAGLGGIRHAIGEISQGSVAPSGLIIDSWVDGPLARNMDGEPALTLIPNLFAAGVVTLLVSLAVVVWAAFFVSRRGGGGKLVFLSLAMLLAGGGFGPPVIGVLAGLAGTRIEAPLSWWQRRLSPAMRDLLARLWPWVFGLSVANGLFLFVGSVLLVYLVDFANSGLVLLSFYLAILSVMASTVMGIAYDLDRSAGREVFLDTRAVWR